MGRGRLPSQGASVGTPPVYQASVSVAVAGNFLKLFPGHVLLCKPRRVPASIPKEDGRLSEDTAKAKPKPWLEEWMREPRKGCSGGMEGGAGGETQFPITRPPSPVRRTHHLKRKYELRQARRERSGPTPAAGRHSPQSQLATSAAFALHSPSKGQFPLPAAPVRGVEAAPPAERAASRKGREPARPDSRPPEGHLSPLSPHPQKILPMIVDIEIKFQ